jgi:hypothetical protein
LSLMPRVPNVCKITCGKFIKNILMTRHLPFLHMLTGAERAVLWACTSLSISHICVFLRCGDGTQGLAHARQMLCHWATAPVMLDFLMALDWGIRSDGITLISVQTCWSLGPRGTFLLVKLVVTTQLPIQERGVPSSIVLTKSPH